MFPAVSHMEDGREGVSHQLMADESGEKGRIWQDCDGCQFVIHTHTPQSANIGHDFLIPAVCGTRRTRNRGWRSLQRMP